MDTFRKEVMGARLIEVRGRVQSSPDKVVHLVAEQLIDRSHDLMQLANDALGGGHALPAAVEMIAPPGDDVRARDEAAPHKIRHPRDVRILPRSRDFH
jgi:error-prone DNA polymerase